MAQEAAPVQVSREVMGTDDIRRALTRIGHEIVERNHGLADVVIVGLQRGGVWIAELLAEILRSIDAGAAVPVGSLDASFHRDDVGLRPIVPGRVTEIPWSLDGTTVVLVDDVLFTGRTVRAALEAINEYGRPRAVQLAVIVDRGHRELPIRPDFVGKNLPTSIDEDVQVSLDGVRIAKTVAPQSGASQPGDAHTGDAHTGEGAS